MPETKIFIFYLHKMLKFEQKSLLAALEKSCYIQVWVTGHPWMSQSVLITTLLHNNTNNCKDHRQTDTDILTDILSVINDKMASYQSNKRGFM